MIQKFPLTLNFFWVVYMKYMRQSRMFCSLILLVDFFLNYLELSGKIFRHWRLAHNRVILTAYFLNLYQEFHRLHHPPVNPHRQLEKQVSTKRGFNRQFLTMLSAELSYWVEMSRWECHHRPEWGRPVQMNRHKQRLLKLKCVAWNILQMISFEYHVIQVEHNSIHVHLSIS